MTMSDAKKDWRRARTMPGITARREGPGWVELDLFTPADLFQFQGHFPSEPVLPGVAQIDWAGRLAREAFALDQPIVKLGALKFSRLIGADSHLTLRLEWQAEKKRVTFIYLEDGTRASSGYFEFA